MMYYRMDELYHHGILGQRWGKQNGPPYPLKSSDHSASEKKAGWRKSLNGNQESQNGYKKIKTYGDANKAHHQNVVSIKQSSASDEEKRSKLAKENEAFNKKISDLDSQEKNKKIAKKVLLAAGGIAVASLVAYSIYKNKGTYDWLKQLESDGQFGNAKLFIDKFEGHEYSKSHLWDKDWYSSLSSDEKRGISKYTGAWYKEMNGLLRNPNYLFQSGLEKDFTEKLINSCTSAMKKASLPEDAIAHRGVGSLSSLAKTLGVPENMLTNPSAARQLIGSKFVDPAFGSTGCSAKDAWSGCKLHVALPKGCQAMYVDPVSSVPGEGEILINRNAKYQIKDIRFGRNGQVEDVFVELLEHVL